MQRSNRQDVLDAVAESVCAVGVRRTTMAEIARRAGISRATVYTHFSDVREATAALLTRELTGLLVAAADGEETVSGDTGREQLVAVALLLARRVPDHPLIERVLELDVELLAPYLMRRLGSSQRVILDALADHIVAGQADGSIRAGDPMLLAFTTFLIVQSFVVSARIAEAEHGREAVLAELATVLDRALAPLVPTDPAGLSDAAATSDGRA